MTKLVEAATIESSKYSNLVEAAELEFVTALTLGSDLEFREDIMQRTEMDVNRPGGIEYPTFLIDITDLGPNYRIADSSGAVKACIEICKQPLFKEENLIDQIFEDPAAVIKLALKWHVPTHWIVLSPEGLDIPSQTCHENELASTIKAIAGKYMYLYNNYSK